MRKIDARKRVAKLSDIANVTRVGTVDGVNFDLRHPQIAPSNWFTYTIGIEEHHKFHVNVLGPFIWFPWYGKFDEAVLAGWLDRETRIIGRPLSSDEQKKLCESMRPETCVSPGDMVSIARVGKIKVPEPTWFLDFPESEIRAATLEIKRANGEREEVETPLLFFHVAQSVGDNKTNNFYRLRDRIVATIEYMEGADSSTGYIFHAARVAAILERLLVNGDAPSQTNNRSKPFSGSVHPFNLASLGVMVGYLWAKSETSETVAPLAEKALRSRQGAAAGGAKSGVKRQNAAWKGPATKYAIQIRYDKPTMSQDKVAWEISERWEEDSPRAPGHRTLVHHVSFLENNRTILRRSKGAKSSR